MTTLNWQKSSYSEGGSSCVHVAAVPCTSILHLYESDTPETVLTTTRSTLGPLLSRIKAGLLDSRPGRLTPRVRAAP